MAVAKIVFVGLLLSGVGGAASAADRGFYFGVLGGQADYEFEQRRLIAGWIPAPPLIGVIPGPIVRPDPLFPFPPGVIGGVVSIPISPLAWSPGADSEAGAWGAIVGYRIFPYAAVELNYLNLGTLEESRTVFVGLPSTGGTAQLSRELETTGPAASALGILPLSDSWELYLRAGVLFGDMESSVSVTPNSGSGVFLGSSSSATFGSESLLWGGGAQFNPGDHWSVRLDFQRFESVGDDTGAGEADIDLLSLGILYRL